MIADFKFLTLCACCLTRACGQFKLVGVVGRGFTRKPPKGVGLHHLRMRYVCVCNGAEMKLVFSSLVSAAAILIFIALHLLSAGTFTREGKRMVFTPSRGLEEEEKVARLESDRWVYLIALGYNGQQAAGVNAFISFQCWAAHSEQPVKIVEPAIRRSRIVSPFYTKSDALKLGDFFDLVHLNNASKSAGLPQVISPEQFQVTGSKDVIFVQFQDGLEHDKLIWSVEGDSDSCYAARTSKKQMDRIVRLGYCIRKIINMKSGSLTSTKLHEVLGSWNHKSVTVVVSSWKGPLHPHAECKHIGHKSTKSQFYPSSRLLRDTTAYIEANNAGSHAYNAVMIRLEHAALLAEDFPERYSIQSCLKEAMNVVDSLQGDEERAALMVAADIGNYGSNSWDWAVSDREKLATGMTDTKRAMMSLFRGQMSFEEWEQTFVAAAGGVSDRGYIAALQRTIASRAQCMVFMGGGNFQYLSLLEFL